MRKASHPRFGVRLGQLGALALLLVVSLLSGSATARPSRAHPLDAGATTADAGRTETLYDRAFFYDANGNQLGWDDLTSGQRRTIDWDEENRIQAIHDNGRTTDFKYNDAGQRVIKRGEQGETAYVNQFWTIRNRTVATKHVFVGSSRIASKLVPGDAHVDPGTDPYYQVLGQWWQHRSDQGWQSGQNVNQNPHYAGAAMPDLLPEDNFAYFYHPDHLGSSEWVTDRGGELYEHVQHFPFGEVWVSERSNTERLPYLFTSKELDEDTGLYYFGARYYDPRTSVWQSTDPALADMMSRNQAHRFATAHVGAVRLASEAPARTPARWTDGRGTGALPFAPGRYDPDSGLVRFGAGDYDAANGSWTGESALRLASPQANLYGYAGADPVNLVDPNGHAPHDNPLAPAIAESVASASPQQRQTALVVAAVVASLGIAQMNVIAAAESGAIGAATTAIRAAASSAVGALTQAADALRRTVTSARGGQQAARAIDPNKLHHIFGKPGHELGPLLERFGGSQEATYRAVESATQGAVRSQGLSGVFTTTVEVAGQTVGVRGRVMEGVARIGSFWIP